MATIYMAPQEGWVPKQGPLTIAYGNVHLKFEDCVADSLEAQRGPDGLLVWALHLLDRRWKWRKCGTISGYYNVRRGFGETAGGDKRTSIVTDTLKTPHELAKLCLEAMEEKGYDVSALSQENAYPVIEWDGMLPSEALAELCELYGCRIVLHINGRVKIEKLGEGKKLALGATGLDGGIAVDSPEVPDSIVILTAPIRWQYDFELEPVGMDLDGWIKPIDELSFTPITNTQGAKGERGWAYVDVPNFNDLTTVTKPDTPNAKTVYETKTRELAQQCVYRWYRIKVKPTTTEDKAFKPIKLPPYKEEIDDLRRILPIEDRQIDTRMVGARMEPLPAWVWGQFYAGYETPEAQVAKLLEIGAELTKNPASVYKGGFSIDRERGIVKFSEPVFLYETAEKTYSYLPAKIYLRTTVNLRDKDTRGWLRHEFKREMPGPRRNTLPQYVRHDDIAYNVVVAGKQATNHAEAEKAADHYLDAVQRKYQTTDPSSFTYAGFQKIDVDGAIQQVTWNLSDDGYATTRASRNREEMLVTPSYQERRFIERLQVVLEAQQFITPEQRQALERSQA